MNNPNQAVSKAALILLLVGLSIWSITTLLSKELIGTAPTLSYSDYMAKSPSLPSVAGENEAISKLRTASNKAPDDIIHLRLLAKSLGEELLKSNPPNPDQLNEMMSIVTKILELDPSDTQALLTMANLNYNHQQFHEAKSLYSRYLEKVPDDLDARVTFASCLTFLGAFDEAETNLKSVLKSDPRHFLAAANLAITYYAMNRKEDAQKIAATALELAPDEEGRKRFAEFIETFGQEDVTVKGNPKKTRSPKIEPPKPESTEAILIETIKSNPIAGSKLLSVTRSKLESTKFEIRFKNFPMQQMPEFARQKFYSGIVDSLKNNGANLKNVKLVFIDDLSGEIMDQLVPSNTSSVIPPN